MGISAETYERVALEDPHGNWELVCGRLRQKPYMTNAHDHSARLLVNSLSRQLDPAEFVPDQNTAKLRSPSGSYFIPDACVLPAAPVRRALAERPRELGVFDDPLPLVVEVWSPSTGGYDLGEKLRGYQERGDREIWLIHPDERTLTAWRKRADGSYGEMVFAGDAIIEPAALAGVRIALAALFA
ncbi:MAG TPA: Uma2 family endonuclease [Dehalococcoidia bacterium]|nr:Uma2 family endonuclease [Dehalococcoidia bacterium]